jgi:5-formyltetrahydrofolate cyclo-ligase
MSSPSLAQKRLPAESVLRLRVKAELRKRLRALRVTTPATACAERSARIVQALEGLAVVREARSVALFWPIEDRHEVDLRALDDSLRARAAVVYYPTILEDGVMVFARVGHIREMQAHPLGFLAPSAPAERETGIDVIVVPAIALDPAGQRIGYGAGYYDRALKEHAGSATVGVAFDFQLVPEVPATEDDVPVEWIVTDRRVMRASRDAAESPLPEEPWGT